MAVATTNLTQLREELGMDGQALLDCVPYEEIITEPQHYDSRAISFRLLFGYIPERWTNKQQEVWVLLYPPSKPGGHAEIQFHSGGTGRGDFAKHDDSNIGATVVSFAVAFKTPKKPSKSKCMALAKYYYLKSLTGLPDELKIPIPITRTFVNDLRVACREFQEAKEQVPHVAQRPTPSTLEDGEMSDFSDALEDLPESPQTVQTGTTIIPEMPPTPDQDDDAYAQLVETFAKLQAEEDQICLSNSNIENESAALEEARQELEERHQRLEELRRVNEEKKAEIALRRQQLLEGTSSEEAFKLGRDTERAEKRRRLA